jgi:hypothetical protein
MTVQTTTLLPYVDEPEGLRLSLNSPDALLERPGIRTSVREATIKQGGAFADVVWPAWKNELKAAGASYQDLVSASAANRNAWRAWADGDLEWPPALADLLAQLNERVGAASFTVTGFANNSS